MHPKSVVQTVVASLALLVAAVGCVTLAPVGGQPAASDIPSGAVVVTQPPASSGPQRTKKPKQSRAPATATPEPTPIVVPPTETPTPTVTETPTTAPTSGPLGSLRFPIGELPSFVFQPDPARLDYTAAPNYGEANLSPGFVPDPYSVGMTSGGDVDVSYLGSSCSGFATSSPDLRINYGGGGSLLRLYFISSTGDTTLVVNDPFGNFYCVDDSFGTVNPTIDFNNPAGGTYDIWVGSYATGTFVSGTFYITESSGNHP
jgi:hypothetical protein